MAVSIRVADFNKGNADYFRAHPSLALCLQKVFSRVYDVTKEKVTFLKYVDHIHPLYSIANYFWNKTLFCKQQIRVHSFKFIQSYLIVLLLQLKIDNGYETNTAASSHTDPDKRNYLSSGCGAVISYRNSGDISEISKAALNLCPIIFEVSLPPPPYHYFNCTDITTYILELFLSFYL